MGYALKPEDRARHEKINPLLEDCGWEIQSYSDANPGAAKGVAVEYFPMGSVGEADYVLFVNGMAEAATTCGLLATTGMERKTLQG